MNITVITPAGRDEYGDPVAGETERCVAVIGVAPTAQGSRSSSSDIEDRNREGLIEACTVYMRTQDTGIAHTDKVLLPGDDRRWDVDGSTQDWTHPNTGYGGSVLVLKRRIG